MFPLVLILALTLRMPLIGCNKSVSLQLVFTSTDITTIEWLDGAAMAVLPLATLWFGG